MYKIIPISLKTRLLWQPILIVNLAEFRIPEDTNLLSSYEDILRLRWEDLP